MGTIYFNTIIKYAALPSVATPATLAGVDNNLGEILTGKIFYILPKKTKYI